MTENFIKAMDEIQSLKEAQGVDIKGKLYTMVQDRVEVFRRFFGSSFGIDTEVSYPDGLGRGSPVIAFAKISDMEGHVIASGWASEIVGSSRFTMTSAIEVAETSAIGRALASFGLHGGEYASVNEIQAAQGKEDFLKQGQPPADERRMVNAPIRSGFYLPDVHEAVWTNPEGEVEKVMKQVSQVKSTDELARYWDELRPFMDVLQRNYQVSFAELKAAFATAHSVLGEHGG